MSLLTILLAVDGRARGDTRAGADYVFNVTGSHTTRGTFLVVERGGRLVRTACYIREAQRVVTGILPERNGHGLKRGCGWVIWRTRRNRAMQPPSTLEDHVTGEFDIEALVGLAGERAAEEHLPRVDCRVSPLSRTTMQPNNRVGGGRDRGTATGRTECSLLPDAPVVQFGSLALTDGMNVTSVLGKGGPIHLCLSIDILLGLLGR